MNRTLLVGITFLIVLGLGAYALMAPETQPPTLAQDTAETPGSTLGAAPSSSRSPATDVAAAPPRDATGSPESAGSPLRDLDRLPPKTAAMIAQAGSELAKQDVRTIFENVRPERRAIATRQRARDDREGFVLSAKRIARTDSDPRVRANAVEALGQLGEEEALQEIVSDEELDQTTRDKANVAIEDAVGFAKLEGLPVDALLPYMHDENLWWQAMELVAAAQDPSVQGALWDIYFDKSQGFERREYALFVLDDLDIEIDEPLEALWIEEEQLELLQLRQSGALN